MEDHGSTPLRRLLEGLPDAVIETHAQVGDATAVVAPAELEAVLQLLREDAACDFDMLMDLTAVDYLPRQPRFEVVHHLYSLGHGHRLRVKTRVSESEPEIATASGIWASADWMEREVWDLYGIRFAGHPDLRRLLLYDEFEGHPLRKDFL